MSEVILPFKKVQVLRCNSPGGCYFPIPPPQKCVVAPKIRRNPVVLDLKDSFLIIPVADPQQRQAIGEWLYLLWFNNTLGTILVFPLFQLHYNTLPYTGKYQIVLTVKLNHNIPTHLILYIYSGILISWTIDFSTLLITRAKSGFPPLSRTL